MTEEQHNKRTRTVREQNNSYYEDITKTEGPFVWLLCGVLTVLLVVLLLHSFGVVDLLK